MLPTAVKIKDLPNTLNEIPNNVYLSKENHKKIHGRLKKTGNTFEISIDDAFSFKFNLKSKNNIDYTFSIHPEKMDNISDVIHVLKLAKGLSSGSIFINDIKLVDFKINPIKKKDIETLSMLINYWERMEHIAKQLKKYSNIVLSPKDIVENSDKDIFNFEILSRSLVDEKPYKLNNPLIDGFSLTVSNAIDISKIEDKTPSFTFLRKETLCFAGKKFTIYITTGIFKVIISEIIPMQKNNDDTSTYYFKISSKNKKIDVSERIFLDEHLAQDYLNNEHTIEELSKATIL